MKFLALLSLVLSFASEAFAAKCCNSPTIWTFRNTGKSAVNLSCSLDSSSAKPESPVAISTGTIAAGGKYEHNWGPNWDNDGMGLIPGHWTCRNVESKGVDAASTIITFITDWGENVLVTWKDTQPTVAKVDPAKDTKPTKAKN